jgi:23S rRNA (cytidine2498-2'-O)-methyltransferase
MQFLWATCQPGNEAWIKRWIVENYPNLHPSYSRPGFVTLKNLGPALPPHFRFSTPLVHRTAISVGKLDKTFESNWKGNRLSQEVTGIHLWDVRDPENPSPPLPLEIGPLKLNQKALPEERILQIALIQPEEFWVGFHQFDLGESPFPGARPIAKLPEHSPSRSYLKLVEMWQETPPRFQAGQIALEVGCSPGGMSLALLERDLSVIGVDAGAVDPSVLNHPRFQHIRSSINHVRPSDIGNSIHWLVMDIHAKPETSVPIFLNLWRHYFRSLRGGFLVLKLNTQEQVNRLDDFIADLQEARLGKVVVRQLPSNRSEVSVSILK